MDMHFMIFIILMFILLISVSLYLNGKLADDIEYLIDSNDKTLGYLEFRTIQNSQLVEALLKLGVSPEWDDINKEYIFFDSKPKKIKKVNKEKQ